MEKKMNLKEFLLLPSFFAVIRFPPLCGGGGGGKNLVMVVVVFVIAARYYRNVVRWWRESTWNGGGGGCVGGFGEEIKKMKRSEITELYLGLVRATISIKFVDTFQRNTAFPISLSL